MAALAASCRATAADCRKCSNEFTQLDIRHPQLLELAHTWTVPQTSASTMSFIQHVRLVSYQPVILAPLCSSFPIPTASHNSLCCSVSHKSWRTQLSNCRIVKTTCSFQDTMLSPGHELNRRTAEPPPELHNLRTVNREPWRAA